MWGVFAGGGIGTWADCLGEILGGPPRASPPQRLDRVPFRGARHRHTLNDQLRTGTDKGNLTV